jgi:hypothetical protein
MKTIRVAALFCTVLFAIGMLVAQTPGTQSSPGQMGTTPQTMPGQQQMPPSQQTPSAPSGQTTAPQSSQGQSNIDNQVSILTEQLNLTSDQQTKLRSILTDQHEQAMTLVKDNTISHEDKIAKIHSLRESTITKVRGMLTDAQKPKFDAMVQQQDERMREREQGGSSPSEPGGANQPGSTQPGANQPGATPPAGTPPTSNPPGAMRPPR